MRLHKAKGMASILTRATGTRILTLEHNLTALRAAQAEAEARRLAELADAQAKTAADEAVRRSAYDRVFLSHLHATWFAIVQIQSLKVDRRGQQQARRSEQSAYFVLC